MNTIILTSGIQVIGEIIRENNFNDLLSIDVKVNTPYFTKKYMDNSFTVSKEKGSHGQDLLVYNSDLSYLTEKKAFTVATIFRKTIKEIKG